VFSTLGRRIMVNTGALTSANLWRIVVSFVLQLLVARTLGLASLGHYTVAMAFLNVSQVLSEVGLPLWLVRRLAHAGEHRRAGYGLALRTQLAAALLVAAGLAALAPALPYPADLRSALVWVAASLPFFAVMSATESLFQAAERLELVLAVEAATNLVILGLSIGALQQGGTVATLLQVVFISQLLAAVLAVILLGRSRILAGPQLPLSGRERLWPAGVGPFFGLTLTDVLLQRLDILLLSLVGAGAPWARLVGVYSAAYALVRVIIKLLQSVWRGLYPTLARLHQQQTGQGDRLAHLALRWGGIACVAGAALGSAIGLPLTRLVYGVADAEVATVWGWLVWSAPLFFVELYATTRLLVAGRARAALLVSALHVGLLAALLPGLAAWGGAVAAAWANLLSQGVAAALGMLLAWRREGR
jgi:O-antigen/teichoic acid export membrane protein